MSATSVRERSVNREIVRFGAAGRKDNGLQIDAQSPSNRIARTREETFGRHPFAMEGGGVAVIGDERPRDRLHDCRVWLRGRGVVEINFRRRVRHIAILAHGRFTPRRRTPTARRPPWIAEHRLGGAVTSARPVRRYRPWIRWSSGARFQNRRQGHTGLIGARERCPLACGGPPRRARVRGPARQDGRDRARRGGSGPSESAGGPRQYSPPGPPRWT